jgi:uncharacterized protein YjdB
MRSTRSLHAAALFASACALSCGGGTVDGGRPAAASVVISPAAPSVEAGRTMQLSAQVHDADGNAVSGKSIFWSSASPSVADVSSDGVLTGVAPGTTKIAASAEGVSAVATVTVTPKQVASIRLAPTDTTLVVGQSAALRASALDSQGAALADATIAWISASPAVATVSASGVVAAVAPGLARITASSGSASATTVVAVQDRSVAGVVISPVVDTIFAGQTTQLGALLTDANGAPIQGRPVEWQSSDAAVAVVSSSGLVTAIAPGSATVTAACEGLTATARVVVIPVPVSSVIISPAQLSLIVGGQSALSVQVRDAAGNVLTGRAVAYTSSDPTVATVASSGVVTGMKVGTATITATSNGQSGTATAHVTPIPVSTVAIAPAAVSLLVGQTATLQASAYAADGTALTGRATTWSSSAPSVASVSTSGVVSAVGAGTAIVMAMIDGVSGTVTVDVSAPAIASVAVNPPTASLKPNDHLQLSATVRDQTGAVVSPTVSWTTSDPTVVAVNAQGMATALAAGTATVSAIAGGATGSATISVSATPPSPQVTSVSVAPSQSSLQTGGTQQLAATVRDQNGNVMSGQTIAWTTSDAKIATVDGAGLVSAAAPGSATITASVGSVSGTASVTVTAAPPPPPRVTSISVAPSQSSVQVGRTQQLSATVRDQNGNAMTGQTVTWTSSNAGVARVDAAGLVTAVAAGGATITASVGAVSGTASVTVTAAPPPPPRVTTVAVSPGQATLTMGAQQQLTATARDQNGNVMAGQPVTWTTSDSKVATVSGGGQVTAQSPGSATITATIAGVSGTASITVNGSGPAVGTVVVVPNHANLKPGDQLQLAAIVFDPRGLPLFNIPVSWSSSNSNSARVSSSGVVTAVKKGNVKITATAGGKADSMTVNVK